MMNIRRVLWASSASTSTLSTPGWSFLYAATIAWEIFSSMKVLGIPRSFSNSSRAAKISAGSMPAGSFGLCVCFLPLIAPSLLFYPS